MYVDVLIRILNYVMLRMFEWPGKVLSVIGRQKTNSAGRVTGYRVQKWCFYVKFGMSNRLS